MSDPQPVVAPPLPRTWRPLGPRLLAPFFGLFLVGAFAFLWVNFDDATREGVNIWQRLTMFALIAGALVLLNAIARSRITASPDTLTIVNGYRKRVLPWGEVGPVRFPQGAPWPHLDLGDGEKLPMMGIHASDGARAASSIRELRAVVAAHRPASSGAAAPSSADPSPQQPPRA
ncbi:PH domain-containing protein [Nocardioides sp.]|uniref:PH domain-containing protein n=1 Tax=Nocardioides sp. TaxID=35761 RepID=UPI0035162719